MVLKAAAVMRSHFHVTINHLAQVRFARCSLRELISYLSERPLNYNSKTIASCGIFGQIWQDLDIHGSPWCFREKLTLRSFFPGRNWRSAPFRIFIMTALGRDASPPREFGKPLTQILLCFAATHSCVNNDMYFHRTSQAAVYEMDDRSMVPVL